jgi:6-phosphofructokinase 1
MGFRAVQLLKDGVGNRVVAMRRENIVDYDIFEALLMKNTIDLDMNKMNCDISI